MPILFRIYAVCLLCDGLVVRSILKKKDCACQIGIIPSSLILASTQTPPASEFSQTTCVNAFQIQKLWHMKFNFCYPGTSDLVFVCELIKKSWKWPKTSKRGLANIFFLSSFFFKNSLLSYDPNVILKITSHNRNNTAKQQQQKKKKLIFIDCNQAKLCREIRCLAVHPNINYCRNGSLSKGW